MPTSTPVTPLKILIVDDEDSVRTAVQMLLSLDGHEIHTAASGEEGLELFAPGRFDLVITDFCMPGINGGEFAEILRARGAHNPIILLTAFPPDEQPAGIDLIVTKPFELPTLRQALTALTSPHEQA